MATKWLTLKQKPMTPKEKAKYLLDIFTYGCYECDYEENAKISALKCANEIKNTDWFIPTQSDFDKWNIYWNEVIQKIESCDPYNTETL